MSKARKDPQKRKLREKAVRQKVLTSRTELRQERKLQMEELRKERQMQIMNNGVVLPAKPGHPEAAARREAEQSKKIADKLAHNLEILKALEKEFEAEEKRRNELNQNLESEGHSTMKEKMDALHEKALKLKGDADALAEAEANYVAQQNLEEK